LHLKVLKVNIISQPAKIIILCSMLTTFSIRQQTLDFVSLNTAVSQTFYKPLQNRVDITASD